MGTGSSAQGARLRSLAAATTSLIALAAAQPARADCSTATAGGETDLTCTDTVTTNSTNENQSNPSTSDFWQRFPTTIDATIASGVTITGRGLLINGTGSNPITVTNDGTVSHTAGETVNGQPVDGLLIIGNGGLVTYRGSGSVTSNATPPQLASGLAITNDNGGINIGSAAAPITGTFSGETALLARSPSGTFINAWIDGGTFTSTSTPNDAIELTARGDVSLMMTGQSVLAGSLRVGVYSNAPTDTVVSVTTDAQITETLGPAVLISGRAGGTSLTLTSDAAITGQATGVALFSAGGEIRLTTAAGSTIHATSTLGANAVQLQPDAGSGTIVADLSGTITSAGAGLFLSPANGAVNVTIREGGSVSGNDFGVYYQRLPGHTGAIDVLNLGTISSPDTAASFDGTLRIGNGGTSGTISGDIDNRGTLVFNRSDALIYDGAISGSGALTQQGDGILTLTGASTYTGPTTVEAGTLSVTGSITSPVTVANGARLSGFGSVGSVTVNGELTPVGSPTGTLTIDGNLTLTSGSNVRFDFAQGASDLVLVTGTASLAGRATIAGNYTAGRYTLLTAQGGLSGTFAQLGNSTLSSISLSYDANNVFLDVTRGTDITTTASFAASLTFVPQITTVNATAYSTRIVGRLMGGTPLYDQTFAAPFLDPQTQSGVDAARLAITTTGGPGVIIGEPVMTARTVTSTTVQGPATYARAGETIAENTRETLGPATIEIGDISGCEAALTAFDGQTRPVCTPNPTPYVIDSGTINVDVQVTGTYFIDEIRTDTVTETIAETWEIDGTVVSTGTVHAAVQSGLFDLGGRLLARLAEQGAGGWGEVYAATVEHGDERETWGLAGGAGIAAAPGLVLGFGVDHGSTDIAVPGAQEAGEVELTELGLTAQLRRGPVFAALSAVYGFGEAETVRTIVGASAASYDADLLGLELDFGYAIDAGAGWTVRPLASLDYQAIETDGFAETGALGLVAENHDAERLRASAGAEVGGTAGGVELAASARYFAMLDGGERVLPVVYALAPGTPLLMEGPGEGDSMLLAARARIPLAPGAALSLGYDGRFGSGYDGHAGFVGVNIQW